VERWDAGVIAPHAAAAARAMIMARREVVWIVSCVLSSILSPGRPPPIYGEWARSAVSTGVPCCGRAFALCCVAVCACAVGERPDLAWKLRDPSYLRGGRCAAPPVRRFDEERVPSQRPGYRPPPCPDSAGARAARVGLAHRRAPCDRDERVGRPRRVVAGRVAVCRADDCLALAPAVAAFVMLRRASPLRREGRACLRYATWRRSSTGR
jgi:hypothetical protein